MRAGGIGSLHVQYLAKNLDGYCGLKGTGISCPIGGNVQVAAH
jgi:peptide-methionine (S)-S-oxide reductase